MSQVQDPATVQNAIIPSRILTIKLESSNSTNIDVTNFIDLFKSRELHVRHVSVRRRRYTFTEHVTTTARQQQVSDTTSDELYNYYFIFYDIRHCLQAYCLVNSVVDGRCVHASFGGYCDLVKVIGVDCDDGLEEVLGSGDLEGQVVVEGFGNGVDVESLVRHFGEVRRLRKNLVAEKCFVEYFDSRCASRAVKSLDGISFKERLVNEISELNSRDWD
ncbi:hypothetical protein HDU76_011347, partial [Blyttiomyces sp. JEL0837]